MYVSEYYVSSHITGFFVPWFNDDYLKTGSMGAGVSLSKGVRTKVKVSKGNGLVNIFVNGIKTPNDKVPVTLNCVDILKERYNGLSKNMDLIIEHENNVPIEAGFGASASAVLGVCFSLRDLLSISPEDCIRIAHETEVRSLSGLGDVIAEVKGGIEIRKTPGVEGIVENIPFEQNLKVLGICLGSKKTESILKDPNKLKIIEKCGTKLLKKLITEPTVGKMMECSKTFTYKTNILTKEILDIIDRITEINSFNAAGIMIGQGVFTFINEEDEKKVLDLLKDIKGKIVISPIAKGLL